MPSRTELEKKTKKFSLAYYLVFVLAIFSLSQFFGAHVYFSQGKDFMGCIIVSLSLISFFGSMLFMTYRIYAEEKDNNNLRVNFMPYEKLYRILNRGVKG